MTQLKNIHGPKGRGIGGSYKNYLKCPIGFLHKNEKEYPRISTFRMLIHQLYHVSDPKFIRHILQTNHRNYEKGFDQEQMKKIFGKSIMTSSGSHWLEMRRKIQPFFHKRKVAGYVTQMVATIEDALEKQALQQTAASLYDFLSKLTLNVVSTCIFGYEIDENLAEVIREQQELLYKRMTSLPLPLWIPTKRNIKFKRNQQIVDQLAETILAQEHHDEDSLFSELKKAGATKKQLKDEVVTLLLAGHETTASVLYFALTLTTEYPQKEKVLRQEIVDIIGSEPISWEKTKQLIYTYQIILEAMRLYPPVWGTSRQAIKDDEIDGYKIKRKRIINLSPYAMHRSERFWHEPEKFQPERFSETPDKYVYFPFGGGPRKCIGETFALTEMLVFMAICFGKYTFHFENPQTTDLQVAITLRPKESVKFMVERSGTGEGQDQESSASSNEARLK